MKRQPSTTPLDLRSDTVTRPTASMRRAMANAEVGDDVMREDPTTIELQEYAAEITGKEAALFTPSGTFANQLAIFNWINPGNEIYLSEDTHIVRHEAGASALIGQALTRTISPKSPKGITWKEIQPRIRAERNIHFPEPGLICLENALSNGTVQTLQDMEEIKQGATQYKLPIHLDGARLFNASLSLNTPASRIAKHCDSLMFCLSKGLGAPVGSLLCSSREFIEKAIYKRKIMGGGMRQTGILAAAGLIALKEELPRLHEDHQKAKILAEAFHSIPAFQLASPSPEINMVFVKLTTSSKQRQTRFLQYLKQENILTFEPEDSTFRFVTHRDVNFQDIEKITTILPKIAEKLEKHK